MTELIKELREITGAGMLDCKNALAATDGNMDAAIDYLREKGLSKAAKKASRIAAEGLTNIKINGNTAVIYEVNAETDFVAKNEEFINLVDEIGNVLVSNPNVKTVEEALLLNVNDQTVDNLIASKIAKIGEKISLRRFTILTKNDNQVFGSYSHMAGKIVALTLFDGNNSEIAKEISMHVAAMNPSYMTKELVPASDVEKEKAILTEQTMAEGKPEEIAKKMVEGRINKFYKENCLVLQEFIKNPDMTVLDYLTKNDLVIKSMIRYAVGEGIEKAVEDFASEVMKQIEG